MPLSLLETFQTLASFEPRRRSLKDAPWEEFVDWAIAQGLAPLAAYNLEYRLGGAGAPEWAKDRLLSVYQGALNDNVMKLVNFKRAIDDLEGRRILVLGGPSFAEALYPHVAFRPVLEIRLLVEPSGARGLAGYLRNAGFNPVRTDVDTGATLVLSDGRTDVLLFESLLGPRRKAEEEAMVGRALPMRVYGPSVFRPELEDALLLTVHEHARAGFQVPVLAHLDIRELLKGAPALGGPYSRPLKVEEVRARARAWRLERALYCAVGICERLFPDAAEPVAAVRPALPAATRRVLDTLVVNPVASLGTLRAVRGAARLRAMLSGGG